MSKAKRTELVDKKHPNLSITKQCELLGVNRSTVYYKPADVAEDDVILMNVIREIWSCIPQYGYRRITRELKANGYKVNRKRVYRLMQVMGIQAIYPKPKTSVPNKEHKIYPYLLGDLCINRVNQVWCVDITYLKMGNGFMYLVALIDVYSRYIIGWEVSNTLEADFCIEMLNCVLKKAKPEIVNSDQGCQFTSDDWIEVLKANEIDISMDGKNRCLDNIYIERFWRSLKYEDFYLKDYQTVTGLKIGIKNYIEFYNHRRWHQALDYRTPAQVYFKNAELVDLWTSPSDQTEPFGTCGQTMDEMLISSLISTLSPTACPHSPSSRPQDPQA